MSAVKLKIGFIGFGEVGSTLAEKLLKCDIIKDNIENNVEDTIEEDVVILSSLENRSEKTKTLLEKTSKKCKFKNYSFKHF